MMKLFEYTFKHCGPLNSVVSVKLFLLFLDEVDTWSDTDQIQVLNSKVVFGVWSKGEPGIEPPTLGLMD